MADLIVPSETEAQKRFLQEGMGSYLDAAMAIISFEREIQRICQRVVEMHLKEYSAALQIRPQLKPDEIRRKVWPTNDDEFDGEWRSAGVGFEGKSIPPSIRWWGSYCLLVWERTDELVYAWVGEWFAPRSAANQVFQKFHAINSDVILDGKEVGLWQPIHAEGAGDIEQKLDGLLRQWIDLWKQVGGTKSAFRV